MQYDDHAVSKSEARNDSGDQIRLPPAPTTFTAGLSAYNSVDVSKRGLNEIMHRPVGVTQAGFNVSFSIGAYSHISAAALLDSAGRVFGCDLGTIRIVGAEDQSLRLEAQGSDPDHIRLGNDRLAVTVHYDHKLQVKNLQLIKTGLTRSMSRSKFSLLIEESGFAAQHPDFAAAFACQFVLEPATAELALRERLAYRQISLAALDRILAAEALTTEQLDELRSLRLSKSQEIRRLAVQAHEILAQRGLCSEEDLALERELSFREDVREDLVFIERTLRNNHFFTTALCERLFGRKEDAASLIGSSVCVNYFARGHNKQIYTVDWTFPDATPKRFAMCSIRDAQLGQGDFTEADITEVLRAWQQLSFKGLKSIAAFGASELHVEWCTRYLEMQGTAAAPALRLFANNFFLIGREFIDNATPLYCMLHDRQLTNQDKLLAMEAAATAYWDVWVRSKDQSGAGFFLRTPRAEDVVVSRSVQGEYTACIVDLDTLSNWVDLTGAWEYFRRYRYYPEGLVQRALERALQQAKVEL